MSKAGGGGIEKVKEMFRTVFGEGIEDIHLNTSVNAYIQSTDLYDFRMKCAELYRNGIPMVNPGIAGKMFFEEDGSKVNIQEYLDYHYETEQKLKVQFELSRAIQNGDIMHIARALSNGAKPTHVEIEGRHFYPIHSAVAEDNANVVQFLLKAGADPNEAYNIGAETALMKAATTGNEKIVRILLCAGANTELRNFQDQTASDIAHEMEEHEIKKIIDRFEKKRQIIGVAQILNECYNFHDFGVVEDLNEYIGWLPPPPPPPPNDNWGGKKPSRKQKRLRKKRKTRKQRK